MNCSKIIAAGFLSLAYSQMSWANLTPVPEHGCGGLEWDGTDATTINIYRDSGEYIESIPGDSIVWRPAESGSYFVVGADNGDWRDWTRSESVDFDSTDGSFCIDPNILTDNQEFTILSPTAVEITWDIDERNGTRLFSHVLVTQFIDGEPEPVVTLATGTRFFADNLRPETDYTFATVNVDQYGAQGDSVAVYEYSTPSTDMPVTEMPSTDMPLMPDGLRVSVYSGTALEVFWENNTDFIFGEYTYTVWLDGVAIASGLDGTSRFIDQLSPGTTYEIGVTVNTQASEQSLFATVTPTTAGTALNAPMQPAQPEQPEQPAQPVQLPNINSVLTLDTAGVIRWSDSGWYQVQDATTFESICEGGSSCAVMPGSYIVINHGTGRRETVDVN